MRPSDDWKKLDMDRHWSSWVTLTTPKPAGGTVEQSTKNSGGFWSTWVTVSQTQVIKELASGHCLPGRDTANKEELVKGVKVGGSLGFSNHGMVEF